MFYSIIGIALLLLSAVTIGCMAAFEIRDRKGDKIQSGKKRSKKPYSQAFLDAIPRAYESSGLLISSASVAPVVSSVLPLSVSTFCTSLPVPILTDLTRSISSSIS